MYYSRLPVLYYGVDIEVLQVQDWRHPPDWSSGDDMPPDHWWSESDDETD